MLSAIELDVHLYDNASARLNMDAYIINMKLHGRAKADLSGSAFETNLNCDCSSTLNYAALNSEHLNKTVNYEAKSFIALQ
jgi:hypothetical protein